MERASLYLFTPKIKLTKLKRSDKLSKVRRKLFNLVSEDLLNDGKDYELLATCELVEANKSAEGLLDDGMDEYLNNVCDSIETNTSTHRYQVPSSFFHRVINSPRTIRRNQLRAKLSLFISEDRHFANLIADRFYYPRVWPLYILEIVLSNDFGYNNRLKLACFFYGNGMQSPSGALWIYRRLNPVLRTVPYAKLLNNKAWVQRSSQFSRVFNYLATYIDTSFGDHHFIGDTYFYYCMERGGTYYFDGIMKERFARRK